TDHARALHVGNVVYRESQMAQVTLGTVVAAFVLSVSLQPTAFAQAVIPSAGIAAETAGRWDEAIRVYRAELERDPKRADLWVRIADIEIRLGRVSDALAELREATHAAPMDASVHFRLSQTLASHDEPIAALQAAATALSLQPDTREYLDATGTLATWAGDYHRAQRSYRRLQTLR